MKSTEPPYIRYLFSKAKALGRPLSSTFEITGCCNFSCKMCYVHNCAVTNENDLTTAQWKAIADELKRAGVLFLLITGGEPLLRSDFAEIYEYAKKCGFEVSVNTNGSLITDEHIELFKKYPPARVNVSLYGAKEETYFAFTGTEGNCEKVKNNIIKLKNNGVQTKVNMSVTNFNKNDMEKVHAFTKENDLHLQCACYMFPAARLNRDNCRPSAKEAAENAVRYDLLRYTEEEMKNRIEAINSLDLSKFGEAYRTEDCDPMLCRGGTASCWITHEGNLTPCGMMPTPSVSLKTTDFEEAWKYINEESKKIRLPGECKNCPLRSLCEMCAASCYAETGSYSQKGEYMCEKAREIVRITKGLTFPEKSII